MDITDFFDIQKATHLRAWDHLRSTGSWPDGFIPEGTTFPTLWQTVIIAKMADAYVDEALLQLERQI